MSDNSSNQIDDNENDFADDVEEDDEEQPIDERSVATLYLKAMAQDGFNTPWDKIAEEMDIPRSQADSIIKKLVQTMVGTHRENNFPRRILEHYNKFAPRQADELTTPDIVTLMRLINIYVEKLKPKEIAKIEEKMKKLGIEQAPQEQPQQQQQPQTQQVKPRWGSRTDSIPASEVEVPHRRVTMTDSSYGGQQQGGPPPTMGQAPSQPPQQGDVYSPFENEESLLKYFLEMNYSVRDPQRISRFLQFFRSNKNGFLANPISLLVALKGMFGDRVAEATMQMFMDARQKLPTTAGSLYRITGASEYKPIIDPTTYLGQANPYLADFMNQFGTGSQFGNQGQGQIPPIHGPEQDPFDKELQRLSKIIGMSMMKGMAQNGGMPGAGGAMGGQAGQGGYDPSLYDVHEVFDSAGRMTERRLVRKGYPTFPGPTQQTQANDKSNEMMIKFMEMMMTNANSDKNLLMQKLFSGDSSHGMNELMATMLKQTMGAMTQNIDPMQKLNQFLELGDQVAKLRQQPQKSAEERRLEMDFLLAKSEMQNKEAEKQREYERQREEANSADSRYQDTVKQVGDIIKEAAGPALEMFKNTIGRGLGGNMPGMFPPGAAGPGGYPPQGMGMPPQQQQQPQERVIIQQVPVQQQPQQQQQPQYTPEQIRLLQQEQMRQQQEAQRQAEMENRPIEDVIGEIPDEQLTEMARQFEDDLIRMEHTGNKVMAELARRKGRGFAPRRQHVAPIVQAMAEHEQQQQYAAQQPQYEEPQEPSINVFEDEPRSNNATSSAVDLSSSYDDDNIRQEMATQGLLSEDDRENESQINADENQSIGVPASTSLPPTHTRNVQVEEEPQEPVVEIDESSIVDDNDNVIEQ